MTLFRGWGVVAATHVLLAVVFGAAYSFGAFLEGIQATFDAGRFSVASLFSVTAFLYYLVGAFSGALADRYSLRKVVAAGIVLLAVGFALASVAPSLAALFVVFGLFAGLGVGLVYVPAVAAVQRWFVRQRSRASGLALAGTGIGTFVGPVAAGLLLRHGSWQATMQIFALGIAVLGLGAAMAMRARPQDLGLLPDGDDPGSLPSQALPQDGERLRDAIRQARFWWYFAAIATGSVGLFVALVHVAPAARAQGIAADSATLLIGLIGVGNVLGRLFLGGLGDRLGPQRLLLLLTLALALLNGVWFGAGSFAALVVFTLLFGAANGGCIALYPAVAAGWFGTRQLGAILGALYIGVGVAALFGASAAGLLFDLRGSYAWPIAASAALALLSALCLARAARWRPRPGAAVGPAPLPTIGP
ncbi:MFS transporter [Variovorax sp. M-6]|uniref:MFS transporter n=1 Tax=Variovorax sp. M-6 TaxID=3233041 RepID=UPI003F960B65